MLLLSSHSHQLPLVLARGVAASQLVGAGLFPALFVQRALQGLAPVQRLRAELLLVLLALLVAVEDPGHRGMAPVDDAHPALDPGRLAQTDVARLAVEKPDHLIVPCGLAELPHDAGDPHFPDRGCCCGSRRVRDNPRSA